MLCIQGKKKKKSPKPSWFLINGPWFSFLFLKILFPGILKFYNVRSFYMCCAGFSLGPFQCGGFFFFNLKKFLFIIKDILMPYILIIPLPGTPGHWFLSLLNWSFNFLIYSIKLYSDFNFWEIPLTSPSKTPIEFKKKTFLAHLLPSYECNIVPLY